MRKSGKKRVMMVVMPLLLALLLLPALGQQYLYESVDRSAIRGADLLQPRGTRE